MVASLKLSKHFQTLALRKRPGERRENTQIEIILEQRAVVVVAPGIDRKRSAERDVEFVPLFIDEAPTPTSHRGLNPSLRMVSILTAIAFGGCTERGSALLRHA